jgi:hypothetical protein
MKKKLNKDNVRAKTRENIDFVRAKMKSHNIRRQHTKPSHCLLAVVIVIAMLAHLPSTRALRVENLRESNKDVSSITIEWSINDIDETSTSLNETSSSSNDDEWLGFKIKYFTNKLQFTPVLLRNTMLRKFRLDNLKSNTEYKIQVSAFNRIENEGPASNLLSVRTLESGIKENILNMSLSSTSPCSLTYWNCESEYWNLFILVSNRHCDDMAILY